MKRNLLTLFLILTLKVFSQQTSPNAASFAIFGQYPQSSFTGVPRINVPVYDFSYEGLSLPIQLSYNTNLVKPNSGSSWVGMGWNLSAGGVINRVVNDKPDDVNFYNAILCHFTNETEVGYYYNHSYLSASNWTDASRIGGAATDQYNYSYNLVQYNSAHIVKDYSPDEFSFTIGQLSGSFYLDHLGNWKVRGSNIKVDVTANDFSEISYPSIPASGGNPAITFPNQKYLNRITLTDFQGIKYIFGGNSQATESENASILIIKSWYLSSVIFPNGRTINYNYDVSSAVTLSIPTYIHGRSNFTEHTFPKVYPIYLREIETDDQIITFYRSGLTGKFSRLDSMSVLRKPDNFLIQKNIFKYISQSVPVATYEPIERLKLTSISQKNLNNQTSNEYKFLYNSTEFGSRNVDHWGYYNAGRIDSWPYQLLLNSREADTLNCRAELLTNVIYPTGGSTEFIWEPHDYSKFVSDLRNNPLTDVGLKKYAGGVRIKKINNYDRSQKIGTKSFSYVKNFTPSGASSTSSGILYARSRYQRVVLEDGFDDTFLFNSFLPAMENNVGSHISYSEVAEINADGSYSIINFSNFDNGLDGEYMDEPAISNASYPTFLAPMNLFISKSHERGYLLKERLYSKSSVLVSEKEIEYERGLTRNQFVRSYGLNLLTGIRTTSEPFSWLGSAVKIYTNSYLPKKETNKIYDTNGLNPVTEFAEFLYDDKNQLKVKTKKTSTKLSYTEYKYPYDNIVSAVLVEMTSRNILSPLVEETDYSLVGPDPTRPMHKELERTKKINYSLWNSNNQIFPESVHTSKTPNWLQETILKYYSYDDKGNALSYSKSNGVIVNSLWGYNKRYKIAEISNADYASIESALGGALAISNFSSNPNPSSLEIETFLAPIRNSSSTFKNAQIITYTYSPLVGMTSQTDPKGMTTYYEYDSLQRLKAIKDQNGNIVKSYDYHYRP